MSVVVAAATLGEERTLPTAVRSQEDYTTPFVTIKDDGIKKMAAALMGGR